MHKKTPIARVPSQVSSQLQQAQRQIHQLELLVSHHRQLQEKFQLSWEMYRAIFETTGTAMIIIEPDMTISLANREFEKLSGYRCAQIEGNKNLLGFISAREMERVRSYHQMRRTTPRSAPPRYETRFVDRRGRIRDVVATVDMIPGTGKSVCSLLDITERNDVERKLRLAEEKYRTIFEYSAAAITVTDARERIVSWNKFAETLLGMGKRQLLHRQVKTLYPRTEWQKIRRSQIRKKGMQHHLETKIIRNDGTLIDVDISISVRKDEAGRVIGAIGIIRDITERKDAERKLRLAEEKYRTIFEYSAAAITVIDARERIVSWNRFAETLLGMGKRQLLHRQVKTLYPRTEWQKIRRSQIRKKGMQHHLETKIIRNDGTLIDVDISISVRKDEAGRVIGAIGIIRDITERRRAEEALSRNRQALLAANQELHVKGTALRLAVRKMKSANEELSRAQDMLIQSEKMVIVGQLSVGIAHEIKNPLAIILQGLEALERVMGQPAPVSAANYIQMMKNAAERANRVIIELLNFSRPSHVELKPTSLHEVINAAVQLVHNNARHAQVDIRCEFAPTVGLINADATLLGEVFVNLLTNAAEAESTHVRIATRLLEHGPGSQKMAQIAISDDGRGIPKDAQPQIFEPFFTTKEKGKGTGLGLTMAMLILKRHRGTITVASRPGEGATFSLRLPVGM